MLSFCISTYNNLEYLKLAIKSVRKNSYFKDAPFIIHAENCDDGTDKWLDTYHQDYNLDYYIEKNPEPVGIGGGMNFCASKVQTEYIMFLHSDFYVSQDWDKACLDVFEKHPNKKLWVSSHRIEPQMFPNTQTRPGTVIVPKDYLGAYWNDFNIEGFEQWANNLSN